MSYKYFLYNYTDQMCACTKSVLIMKAYYKYQHFLASYSAIYKKGFIYKTYNSIQFITLTMLIYCWNRENNYSTTVLLEWVNVLISTLCEFGDFANYAPKSSQNARIIPNSFTLSVCAKLLRALVFINCDLIFENLPFGTLVSVM